MRTDLYGILRKLLFAWGVVSLLSVSALGVFLVYQFTLGNTEQVDQASIDDVGFVLNGCGLGAERIERVVHSHVSARSFTGDHLDAYAIKLSRLDLSELLDQQDAASCRWYRGDELPPLVDAALEFVGAWLGGDELAWFPHGTDLRSTSIYIHPMTTVFRATQPTAVEMIIVRPADRMIYYFSGKT